MVALSTATPGATIYYTTDGTTPTTRSPIYSAPLEVIAATTLSAMSVARNYSSSPTSSATYTVNALQVTETVLHSFSGGLGTSDGQSPAAALIQGTDGNFYGTTPLGGASVNCPVGKTCGTVFKITPSGVETVLYAFGGTNAVYSGGPVTPVIQSHDGNFYGLTEDTFFQLTPSGVETSLYSFDSSNPMDGYAPVGLIQGNDGNFYGITQNGGALEPSWGGTVFKITPSGLETLLYSFGSNLYGGDEPAAGLIQGRDGNFYGTTTIGGEYIFSTAASAGTVYRITPAGDVTVLYSFGGYPNDGVSPAAALVQGNDGSFYGTTETGGAANRGTVFKITPSGTETVLYSFAGYPDDGQNPEAALILGNDGNLYGTTAAGGATGNGTVFRITPSGVETVLHSFAGYPGDGASPFAPLIQGTDGCFYGTTSIGGAYSQLDFNGTMPGDGTVFKLTVFVTR